MARLDAPGVGIYTGGMFHRGIWLLFLSILVVISVRPAQAQFEHQLVRRMVVFPFKVDAGLEATADEAWWQAREELTKSRRFLVASKQFLVKSDVFQPRADLEPADAIILGKLLDAHALVTFQLNGRKLTLTVYDGGNGVVLFRKAATLHPSLSVGDQIAALGRKMVNDFTATMPYQGYTTVDSLIGHAVFQDGDAKLAHVDLGIASAAQIGDIAQWIRITGANTGPLFQGGGKMTIFAEGKIIKIDEGSATVEILRATSLRDIKEFALVRVPREADRLVSEFTLNETPRTTLTAELVAPEAAPMEQVAKERRPLLTTFSFVGSIAAFLLLAF